MQNSDFDGTAELAALAVSEWRVRHHAEQLIRALNPLGGSEAVDDSLPRLRQIVDRPSLPPWARVGGAELGAWVSEAEAVLAEVRWLVGRFAVRDTGEAPSQLRLVGDQVTREPLPPEAIAATALRAAEVAAAAETLETKVALPLAGGGVVFGYREAVARLYETVTGAGLAADARPARPSPEFVSATPTDLRLLRLALGVAAAARAEGRHPFGALVAHETGRVVVERGNNSRPPSGDPTQHAELAAAAAATHVLSPEQRAAATLYTSAEPCAMCAGAIYWTGIGRVVYALSEERLLSLTGAHAENPTLALPCREVFARGQRVVEVHGPLLEDEAARVHEGFWV